MVVFILPALLIGVCLTATVCQIVIAWGLRATDTIALLQGDIYIVKAL